MQCNTIQHNTTQRNTIQYNAMQCNTKKVHNKIIRPEASTAFRQMRINLGTLRSCKVPQRTGRSFSRELWKLVLGIQLAVVLAHYGLHGQVAQPVPLAPRFVRPTLFDSLPLQAQKRAGKKTEKLRHTSCLIRTIRASERARKFLNLNLRCYFLRVTTQTSSL